MTDNTIEWMDGVAFRLTIYKEVVGKYLVYQVLFYVLWSTFEISNFRVDEFVKFDDVSRKWRW